MFDLDNISDKIFLPLLTLITKNILQETDIENLLKKTVREMKYGNDIASFEHPPQGWISLKKVKTMTLIYIKKKKKRLTDQLPKKLLLKDLKR